MHMVDEILSDGRMDKLEKIEKLEAILSAVTSCTPDQLSPNNADASCSKCGCMCRSDNPRTDRQAAGTSVACQTLSTGDIVITRVFVSEEEKERLRLQNSPKK